MTPYGVDDLDKHSFKVMPFRLLNIKPLTEPKCNDCHSRKFVWKCRLKKWPHYVNTGSATIFLELSSVVFRNVGWDTILLISRGQFSLNNSRKTSINRYGCLWWVWLEVYLPNCCDARDIVLYDSAICRESIAIDGVLETITNQSNMIIYSFTVGTVLVDGSIVYWTSNAMASRVWDEIIYQFPNFHGCTVEVLQWISNFVPMQAQWQPSSCL